MSPSALSRSLVHWSHAGATPSDRSCRCDVPAARDASAHVGRRSRAAPHVLPANATLGSGMTFAPDARARRHARMWRGDLRGGEPTASREAYRGPPRRCRTVSGSGTVSRRRVRRAAAMRPTEASRTPGSISHLPVALTVLAREYRCAPTASVGQGGSERRARRRPMARFVARARRPRRVAIRGASPLVAYPVTSRVRARAHRCPDERSSAGAQL